MNNTIGRFLPFILAILLTSCASGYRTINPASLNYQSSGENQNLSYKYNVLKERRNTKIAKKEDKFKTRIVAVKIENTTGRTLKYGENYKIYSGDGAIRILEPDVAAYSIRQKVPAYLLYLLLSGTTLNTQSSFDAPVKKTPIGLVIGPGLAAINMIVAGSSNKKLRENLEEYSVINREIKSGDTFYGLIAIVDNGFMPLSIKMVK